MAQTRPFSLTMLELSRPRYVGAPTALLKLIAFPMTSAKLCLVAQSLESVVLPEGMSLETYQDLKALAAELEKQQLGTIHREWYAVRP